MTGSDNTASINDDTNTDEKRRILRAMNDMPYAAGIVPTVPWSYNNLTDDQIADFLEALGKRLRVLARDSARDKSHLDELRHQREAIREFLGTNRRQQ